MSLTGVASSVFPRMSEVSEHSFEELEAGFLCQLIALDDGVSEHFLLDAFGFGLAIEGERRFEGTNTAGEMIGAEGHGVGSNCPDSSESCRLCQSATQCGLITPDGGSHVSLSCVCED